MKTTLLSLALTVAGAAAHAAACDYKPSQLAAMATGSLAGGAAVGTEAARRAGHYALVHPGTSAQVVGTAAGAVAGATAKIGTVGAILMSPISLTVGSVAAAGGAVLEGVCYFQVERITDPAGVRQVLADVAAYDERAALIATPEGEALELRLEGEVKSYAVDRLYVADGRLKHRDRLRNTDLGPIILVAPETTG